MTPFNINSSWEGSVINILNSKHLPNQKFYRWIMPRQSGVTSFLTMFANVNVNNGEYVLYISDLPVRHMQNMLDKNVEIIQVSNFRNINLKGRSYNWILVDSIKIDYQDIVDLYPCISLDGKIVWISTSEGNLIK